MRFFKTPFFLNSSSIEGIFEENLKYFNFLSGIFWLAIKILKYLGEIVESAVNCPLVNLYLRRGFASCSLCINKSVCQVSKLLDIFFSYLQNFSLVQYCVPFIAKKSCKIKSFLVKKEI